MSQLLAHLIGDYVLQSHEMATRKTSSWAWALIHAYVYGIPFAVLGAHPWQLAIIIGTHALIDRYRLAAYWCRWYGVGFPGIWHKAVGGAFVEPPPFLGVWLVIIVDNTMHLCINAAGAGMNPLPPAVAARWARNWSPEAHPERPWWCAVHSTIMSGSLVRWRRSDGRETDYYKVPVTWGTHDDPALFFVDTPRAELARIDAAHPLPAPDPMPGQVWAWPHDASGRAVVHEQTVVDVSQGAVIFRDGAFYVWPPPGAILVYGPSQYGANVPWGPGVSDIDVRTPPDNRNSGEPSGWFHMPHEARSFVHPILSEPVDLFADVPDLHAPIGGCQMDLTAYVTHWPPDVYRSAHIARCEHGRLAWFGDPMVVAMVLSPREGLPDNDERDSLQAAFDVLRTPEDCP